MADLDLVIIGAGAAGIGAARAAAKAGLSYRLVEASHRIGGRAYTEDIAPG
ncbi:MAG TPA: NAD(P)-binding protein, partial [Dongiaceae bacterium]|nr:NAD(P)-binding protein [Dongiaceae bacterium]